MRFPSRRVVAKGRQRQKPAGDGLATYRAKRDFSKTPEPSGAVAAVAGDDLAFVVQKHRARQLHYDLRLEMDGVLRSWAVAKGPSLDPKVKRLAVATEDHPMEYGSFEGVIPAGQYGGGTVMVWDRGHWVPQGEPAADFAAGQIKFRLAGSKLKGGWTLVRTTRADNQWLLIKERDIFAVPEADGVVTETAPDSALSARSIEQIAAAGQAATTAASRKRTRVPPRRLANAVKGALPRGMRPQLAATAAKPPAGTGWLHEIKHDGYRTIAELDGGAARLLTRNGHDWTDRYGAVAAALTRLPCKSAVLDGEICVQTPEGRTDFGLLKEALSAGHDGALVYLVFDLLYLDGYDLRATPLIERKVALEALLDPVSEDGLPVQFSEHMAGRGADVYAQAAAMGLEGIIAKRASGGYASGRSRDWLKIKSVQSDGFTIVGYTASAAAGGLGALLMAADDGEAKSGLRYVGRVGTGFDEATVATLLPALRKLARKTPAVAIPREAVDSEVRFVRPKLVADVSYGGWTRDGNLRHAAFRGLREDVSDGGSAPAAPPVPTEVTRPARQVTDRDLANIWVTNPDRVMFGAGGPSKLDLVMYYAQVGDWILAELARRPVTLVRCPTGDVADIFYQRHGGSGIPREVKRVPLREEGGKGRADYLYIDDAKGLLALAQFGVIEFHPWGCRVDKPERPDRVVFDLDPDEGLDWREVVDAATQVRDELADLGFAAYVRTTGGKGLHVVTPVARRHNWAAVKGFSRAFVTRLAAREPTRYTATSGAKNRRGRIFIDYLRNGRGATAAGSYSLRARPGAPAATPLTWAELDDVDDPAIFDHATVARRVAALTQDPWYGIDGTATSITRGITEKLTKYR